MKKFQYLIVALLLIFLIVSASGKTVNFDKSSGTNYFKGSISVGSGTVAVSLAAVQDATTPKSDIQTSASDAGGDASAGQDTSAAGQAVFTASAAANSNGDSARTNDLASGDNAAVETEQGAHATDTEAGAGQHDTTVSGEVASASSSATSNEGCEVTSASSSASATDGTVTVDHQGAEAGNSAQAGQEAAAQGQTASLTTSTSNGVVSATTSTTATNGNVEGEQHAGAGDNGAGASQDTVAEGDTACAETTVTKEQRGPDTIASVTASASDKDGGVATVSVEQHAGAGTSYSAGAGAQQNAAVSGDKGEITATVTARPGTASAVTTVKNGFAFVTEQNVEAEHHEVEAEQSGGLMGSSGSMVTSANGNGDSATTFDFASGGHDPQGFVVIASEQEAEAGHSASASQDSVIGATGRAVAGTVVEDKWGNNAGTIAKLNDGGLIETKQGAAAGGIFFYPIVAAGGVGAGQVTDLSALNGGSTESWASNKHADE
ncbi:MAG: hypothetical protein LUQ69_00790, partial [Methanoregulaceae archaeon]|nr:hypothetical protein [Methanoregulaceae archaeon]